MPIFFSRFFSFITSVFGAILVYKSVSCFAASTTWFCTIFDYFGWFWVSFGPLGPGALSPGLPQRPPRSPPRSPQSPPRPPLSPPRPPLSPPRPSQSTPRPPQSPLKPPQSPPRPPQSPPRPPQCPPPPISGPDGVGRALDGPPPGPLRKTRSPGLRGGLRGGSRGGEVRTTSGYIGLGEAVGAGVVAEVSTLQIVPKIVTKIVPK